MSHFDIITVFSLEDDWHYWLTSGIWHLTARLAQVCGTLRVTLELLRNINQCKVDLVSVCVSVSEPETAGSSFICQLANNKRVSESPLLSESEPELGRGTIFMSTWRLHLLSQSWSLVTEKYCKRSLK